MKIKLSANLILLFSSFVVAWVIGNWVLWSYDWLDPRPGLIVFDDEIRQHKNTIPLFIPQSFVTGDVQGKIVAYKKKGVLDENFILLPQGLDIPLGSVPNARMIYCQEDEGWYITELDRYGFSNDDAVWGRSVDILLVGDSYSQGACTHSNTQNTLIDKGYAALSIGTGGNGPLTEFAVLKEYFRKFEAKSVAWLIVDNDIARSEKHHMPINFDIEYDNQYLRQYLDDDTYHQDYFNIARLTQFSDNSYKFFQSYWVANQGNIKSGRTKLESEFSGIFAILTGQPIWKRVNQLQVKQMNTSREGWRVLSPERKDLVLDLYQRAYEMTKSQNANIVFGFLQSKGHCYGKYQGDPFGYIRDYFDAKNIPYFNFEFEERSLACNQYIARKKGGHYTASGYALLAERIISEL